VFGEFKKFAMRGNVLDLAIGIIIGGAFGKIVASLVGDIIMPILGLVVGGVNFTNLQLVVRAATATSPAITVMYGQFIQSVVDFLIVAFAIFMVIKALNRFQRKAAEKPAGPPAPSKEEILLTEIRDAIRKQSE